MESIPFQHVVQRAPRKLPVDDAIRKLDRDLERAVSRMKVRRGMIVVVHRDHDSEKSRYFRHALLSPAQRIDDKPRGIAPPRSSSLERLSPDSTAFDSASYTTTIFIALL